MSMKNFHGFTLIETLVAVTIISLSVVAPMFAASNAIKAAQVSQDKLTASYLAQEGIEYMRLMRDNEYLTAYRTGGANISTNAWTAFVSGTNPGSITQCIPTVCLLDPSRTMGVGVGLSLQTCTAGTCTPLYLNGGRYTQQAVGTKTAFTRTISGLVVSGTKLQITSTVSWSFHGTPYTVKINDYLTPWQ